MKCAVAILTVALASQCLANPVGDVYSDLIVDVLTYAKQQLQAHDPLSLPDIKNEKIVDQNVNLVVSQTNTKLSKASTFTVEEVSTDPATLTATVRVKIPVFVQSGDYVISGESYNRNVSGQGTISVALVDFDQLMSVTVVNPDTSLQISSLDLKYNVSSVNAAILSLLVAAASAGYAPVAYSAPAYAHAPLATAYAAPAYAHAPLTTAYAAPAYAHAPLTTAYTASAYAHAPLTTAYAAPAYAHAPLTTAYAAPAYAHAPIATTYASYAAPAIAHAPLAIAHAPVASSYANTYRTVNKPIAYAAPAIAHAPIATTYASYAAPAIAHAPLATTYAAAAPAIATSYAAPLATSYARAAPLAYSTGLGYGSAYGYSSALLH